MKPPKNSLVLSAALAGLLSGTMDRVMGAPAPQAQGQSAQPVANPNPKHACAAKNECKGTGGCATDGSVKNKLTGKTVAEKHACAGKNSCKGNGGCATDGSVKNMSKAKK